METKILDIPKHFKYYNGESIMSNFEHTINKETAEAIKGKELFSSYPAMYFYGIVWWDSETFKWCCYIKQCTNHIETLISDTLEEIMDRASKTYGYD